MVVSVDKWKYKGKGTVGSGEIEKEGIVTSRYDDTRKAKHESENSCKETENLDRMRRHDKRKKLQG